MNRCNHIDFTLQSALWKSRTCGREKMHDGKHISVCNTFWWLDNVHEKYLSPENIKSILFCWGLAH